MKAQYQENQTVNPLGSPAMVINTPPVGQEKPKPSRESDSAAPLARWFSNLPIKRKQLGALLLSELISIGGLSSIGALLIYLTGQRQLASQAQSEVAVTQIGYMIKVNQMGFGFRGQSDNLAIINAAKDYKQGKPIDDKLRGQVGEILRNEVKARKIEYATLVGSDYRIIVNANRDRRGMVVDDSINVRRFLALTLEKSGYRVQQAKDGQEAMEKLQDGLAIAGVICDIEMPRLDGYGFLAQVRAQQRFRSLPIMMLTSRSGDKHRQMAFSLGASAYFSKPFQEQELLQTLKSFLDLP